ncbi:MAG TPA: tryptophan--tRNA ligase [Sandaracinaceae bacterium LLY-WYZ-13_1]|nr:tryptophan--tRNA ligase [Sandaracinaceae bacterium LLY-WYZ-13_1]
MKRSLTGIKPSGTVHLGNYLGAIRPALALAREYESFLFIADYHALTTVRDPAVMRDSTYDVAAAWIACGLDPETVHLYRQSDVPEVFELTWVLSCLVATGQLERGVAYKDALSKGEAPNAGIFNYPLLMAADILLYDADVVPVGKDQLQHLELTRDAAARVNHVFGEGVLVVPEARITEAPLVPGLDGRKMSKSYGNAIPLFGSAKQLRKTCMKIVTGSETLEEPKEPEGTTVFELYRLVADEARAEALAVKLREGGYGWGHAKQDLYEALEAELGPKRETYHALRADPSKIDRILHEGAERVRPIARRTLDRVRDAIGVGPR